MEEVYNSWIVWAGSITGIIGFGVILLKGIIPLLGARDKYKKIDNIDKNYENIEKHSDEIKQLKESVDKVEQDVKSLTEVTGLVASGVKILLGEKLGYINNKKQEEEIYENFLKRERVI